MQEQTLRKRNFYALMMEGTFFFSGMAFVDVNAVIPLFIFAYTDSVALAGLATTLHFATSIIMQTLLGPYIKGIKNIPRFIIILMLLFRPLPFIMIPVLFSNLNPFLVVSIFLVIYALLWGGDGLVVIPWMDLFGRTIEQKKRGPLLGYQQLFGGTGALIAGFIIKTALDSPNLNNDQRYAIIFGAAAFVLSLSCFAMLPVRDLPRPVETEKTSRRNYYRQLPAMFKKNHAFKKLALIRILASFTSMVAPFVILFNREQFGLSASQVSTLVYIQIIGGLIGGVFWGRICSRLGNHRAILASQIIGLTITSIAIIFSLFSVILLPVVFIWPMVLINGVSMGSWIGFMNYAIDIVDEADRTVYLLLLNLITFPFTFLAFLAGLIAQYFGYLPIFVISALSSLIAIYFAAQLKFPANNPDMQLFDPVTVTSSQKTDERAD